MEHLNKKSVLTEMTLFTKFLLISGNFAQLLLYKRIGTCKISGNF